MAEKAIRRGRSATKVEVNGHITIPDEVVGKRGKKAVKTDNKNAAKIEKVIPEEEEKSTLVENKDLPKKRGKKQPESKPSDVDKADDKVSTETEEVKDLPAKRGRKKVNKSEDTAVETNDTEPNEEIPVKKSKRVGRKAAEQLTEDACSASDATFTVTDRKRKKVQKPDQVIENNEKEKSPIAGETRQLKVALKRNQSLDNMAATQLLKDNEALEENTVKVEEKHGKRSKNLDKMAAVQLSENNEDVEEEPAVKTTKGPKGRGKRAVANAEESKPAKKTKESAPKSNSGKKEKIPDVTALDFDNASKTADGKAWNLKVASWNINGIRAWLEKNGMSYLHHEKPDILCLQETKCSDDKLPSEVNVEGYHSYWLAGDKDGYSGVGLLSKQKPLSVQYGIGMEKHDSEGRVITAEYESFYLVATYVPNAGRGLVRLDYRQEWDKDLCSYLKKLDDKKPVVLCGDLNVAHEEIDLANPKTNKKNAGFTKEEREGFSTLLSEGFVDTFRHLYPDEKGAYTFWTYMMNARAKNVGWRLDYFVVSKKFVNNICDSLIRKDVYGSDHCPICLFLHV